MLLQRGETCQNSKYNWPKVSTYHSTKEKQYFWGGYFCRTESTQPYIYRQRVSVPALWPIRSQNSLALLGRGALQNSDFWFVITLPTSRSAWFASTNQKPSLPGMAEPALLKFCITSFFEKMQITLKMILVFCEYLCHRQSELFCFASGAALQTVWCCEWWASAPFYLKVRISPWNPLSQLQNEWVTISQTWLEIAKWQNNIFIFNTLF